MIRTLGRSWKLLSKLQKSRLAVLMVFRVILNGMDVVGIAIIGAVTAIAVGADISVGGILGLPQSHLLTYLLAAAGVIFIVKTLVGLVLSRSTALYLAGIEVEYSLRIADSVFKGTINDLKRFSKAEIEWSILRSSQKAFTGLLGNGITFLAELTLTIAIFAYLLWTNWALALGVTVYFGFILVLFQLYTRRVISRSGVEFAEGSVGVNDAISDLLSAFREITVMSKTDSFFGSLATARGRVARAEATYGYIGAIPRLIVELGLIVGALGFVAAQWVLGGGPEGASELGVFLAGSLRMMSALLPLQRAFQYIRFESPAALSAQDLLTSFQNQTANVEPSWQEITDLNELEATSLGALSVELKEVSFSYTDSAEPTTVLRNVTFGVAPGSTVAIIGPSGAGKSSLVDLILGLHKPTDGTVLCGGLSPLSLRRSLPGSIAYVPQKPGLVSGTLAQNIALGVEDNRIDEAALQLAIEKASLREYVDSLPNGARTQLGKQLDSLSGGQIQRLGLARALYAGPRLLVLDEATSALDAETEADISKSLDLLRGETTVIVVAHRISTIQSADKIIVLDGGKVMATGTFVELLRSSSMVRRYVDLMSFGGEE